MLANILNDGELYESEKEEYEKKTQTDLIYKCIREAEKAKKEEKPQMISDKMIREIASGYRERDEEEEDLDLIFGEHMGLAKLFCKYNSDRVKLLSSKTGYIFNDKLIWEYIGSRDTLNNIIGNELLRIIKIKFLKIKDKENVKKVCKIIENCQKNYFIKAISDFVCGMLYDPNFMGKLNSSHYELPIKNGKIINLKTKQIRNRLRTDYFDYEIDAEYQNNQEHAQTFFSSIMCNKPDQIEYLKKILGYSISGDMSEQKIFISWGKGSNGKSALYNELIEGIFTKNVIGATNKKVFIKSDFQNSHTEHLVSLIGKRIAMLSETDADDQLNETQIKAITGGDSISARKIYGSEFEFKPVAKLHMLTNHKPVFKLSESMTRRLVYIGFNAKFCDNPSKPNEYKRDPDLINDLKTKYRNEVFSWIIDGSYTYFQNNSFGNPPQEFDKQKNEWYNDLDSVQSFISYYYEVVENVTPLERILRGDLYDNYKNYCKTEEIPNLLNKKDFYADMLEKGHEAKKIQGNYYYCKLKKININ